MAFRERLFATLRAVRPVLEEPGVLIVGSEVPNLLQPGAASTLVVSQDVDIGVPVDRHAAVKRCVGALPGFRPYRGLRPELRHAARSSLTLLSLMAPRPGMPDPRGERARVAGLLRRLEAGEPDLP